ncbi:MAG: hypothetical protein WC289_01355 [Patescibacteria group bacterium]|jgi:hypothetical protein
MKRALFIFLLILTLSLPLFSYAQDVTLPNPLGSDFSDKDLITVLVQSLKIVLGAVDIFALFMFIIGGFELLMSGGSPTLVKKGKDTILWATLGILTITFSYSILKFIFESLNTVT